MGRYDTGSFAIDKHKLMKLITQHDKISVAGVKCGYCGSYFSMWMNQGCISRQGADALEDVYGIKPEEYKSDTDGQISRRREPGDQYKAIASGIVDAVRFLIFTGELNEALVKAVKQALSEYFEEDESNAE